ncbi:ABC transporter ATP-binding protein, partial [Escherichia coli]|nr:ABC transporter ATP-binding protein [Escherichia coli]
MNIQPDHEQLVAQDDGVKPGDLLMDVKNVSLRFGGVKAITDISFNVRKGEIRA